MATKRRRTGRPRHLETALARWCERRGVRYSDLADRIGVTDQAVGQWGRGLVIPRAKVLAQIAAITRLIEEEQGASRPRGVLVTDWFVKLAA